MYNLLQLFVRFGGFFLFLFLEFICFYFVVQYNQRQKAIYITSVNNFTGYLDEQRDALTAHFGLEDVVDSLARENARLRQQLINLDLDWAIEEDSVQNTLFGQKYVLMEAKVLKNSINAHHNYLTLNRGKNHGVQPHSAVISRNGIVGIIRKVKDNHSVAMSLLHRQTRISAAVKGKEKMYRGTLQWEDDNPQHLDLNFIPKHANFERGDTVVTSGYSAMFPEGIMIGIVDTARLEASGNSYIVKVLLKNDLSSLDYVNIVTNLYKDEQIELEQAVTDE